MFKANKKRREKLVLDMKACLANKELNLPDKLKKDF